MTGRGSGDAPPPQKGAVLRWREAAALRQNLQRRKAQERARSAAEEVDKPAAAAEPDSSDSG